MVYMIVSILAAMIAILMAKMAMTACKKTRETAERVRIYADLTEHWHLRTMEQAAQAEKEQQYADQS